MAKRLVIKKGEKYNRMTIMYEVDSRNEQRMFMCLCDCGNEKVVAMVLLRNEQTKSCGCLKREHLIKINTKHGLSPRGDRNKLQAVWVSMRQRCNNEKSSVFHYYGGRGISVHDSWSEFIVFYEWAIKNGYKEGLTIERVNNNGNYEPSNCTWIPQSEQSKNTRRSLVNKIC